MLHHGTGLSAARCRLYAHGALCSSAVVPKKPTEPLSAFDRTPSSECINRLVDESVANSLVIALAVVVRDVLAHRSPKVRFSDRNDLSQTFRFDRANESLGVRVQVRTPTRKPHGSDAGAAQDLAEALR